MRLEEERNKIIDEINNKIEEIRENNEISEEEIEEEIQKLTVTIPDEVSINKK